MNPVEYTSTRTQRYTLTLTLDISVDDAEVSILLSNAREAIRHYWSDAFAAYCNAGTPAIPRALFELLVASNGTWPPDGPGQGFHVDETDWRWTRLPDYIDSKED